MTENELSKVVVNACFKIHTILGPGLLESVYEHILSHELMKNNLYVERQQSLPVIYEGIELEVGFRTDLIINRKLIIEIKSIETLAPVHYKQLLTYLKLTDMRLGLLINFNENLIKDGIKRVVNNL